MRSPNEPTADAHPLVVELFKLCPPTGGEWPLRQRVLWLEAMEAVFRLIFQDSGGRVVIGAAPEELPALEVTRTAVEPGLLGKLKDCPAEFLKGGVDILIGAPKEPADEKPAPDRPAEVAPHRGRGPRIANPDRPPGIPTNLEMVQEVLRHAGRPLGGSDIRDMVRAKWWPGCPKDWKSTPFGFLQSGKLIKNADGLFTLPPEEAPPSPEPPPQAPRRAVDVTIPPRPQARTGEPLQRPVAPPARPKAPEPPAQTRAQPLAPVRPPAPAPPAAAPPAAPPPVSVSDGREFEHRGKSVVLRTKEWRVVSRLYTVMTSGGGMLDFKALTDHAFKGDAGRAIDPRLWLGEIEPMVNLRLAPLGLAMVSVSVMPNGPKAGYVLRAVER